LGARLGAGAAACRRPRARRLEGGGVGEWVVMVSWTAGEARGACVASLADDARRGCEVIVVDNASSDGSLAAVRPGFPWVTVVETGANLGFAAGANQGAAHARGDVLVFLNPDARVLPDAVRTLADTLRLVPAAGIAGGGLVDATGRWQPSAARFGPGRHLVLDTTLGRLGARARRLPPPGGGGCGPLVA